MIEIFSNSYQDTENFGKEFSKTLMGTEVIALFGELGVGKTCFVRGIANGLGLIDDISSPTFTIVNEYMSGKFPVYHFDMYRILSVDDLCSIGFFDYVKQGLMIIEWSENIRKFLPSESVKIFIDYSKDQNNRTIKIYN